MSTIKEIIASPEKYGFRFDNGPVRIGGQGDKGRLLRADAPHISVTDVPLFGKSFPEVILAHLNGAGSIRVRCQGITRNALDKTPRLANDALKEMLVGSILLRIPSARGTAVVVKSFVFMPNTGEKVEVTEANLTEVRQRYTAELVDAGLKSDKAIALAEKAVKVA